MRIVVNGWFWDHMTAGSGQYLAGLAAVLPRITSEHELILALPHGRTSGKLPEGWRTQTAATPLARLSTNLAKVWFEQITFPRLCRQLGADVAFVPYWGSPWWRPCPVVVTVHDLIPVLLPLYRGGLVQRLYTWLVGAAARRADAVITDSEASRRDIVRHLGIPAERVHAVYLAAGGQERAAAEEASGDVRTRLKLPDAPFLLYLGGFDARKNLLRTIQGYAQMVQRCRAEGHEAPRLVIAGKLPSTDSAFAPDPRPLVEALGLDGPIQFVGWVDEADKASLYRLAAGVVFISEYEGFGLPVLEAMTYDHGAVPGSFGPPAGAIQTNAGAL